MTELWRNWSRIAECTPATFARPRNLAEVCEVVNLAVERGQTIRPVGNAHSFSPVCVTDGCMISLAAMDRVLEADRETGLVRVEAGISIHKLSRELAALGLALPSLGDIDVQSIAGAASTSTHGTGARHVAVSSRIDAVQLVTAAGDVLEIDHNDQQALKAARVSLGALGVVTALTLRCVPAFTLDRLDIPFSLEETLDSLDDEPDRWDHWEFFVFPHTTRVLQKRIKRTDAAPKPPSSLAKFINDIVFENWLLEVFCRLGRRAPKLIPRLSRTAAALFSTATRVESSHEIFSTVRNVRFIEMEYAIPREFAREAVERVLAVVEAEKFAVNFPIEVRVGAADDSAWLATGADRATAYVAVHVFNKMEHEPYFRAVEAIMADYRGRPHWGKVSFLDASELSQRYDGWDEFQAVRRRLDPNGSFSNAYINKILGPVTPA